MLNGDWISGFAWNCLLNYGRMHGVWYCIMCSSAAGAVIVAQTRRPSESTMSVTARLRFWFIVIVRVSRTGQIVGRSAARRACIFLCLGRFNCVDTFFGVVNFASMIVLGRHKFAIHVVSIEGFRSGFIIFRPPFGLPLVLLVFGLCF